MTSRIAAIVTAYERIEQTLSTLRVLKNCQPPPAEILVHVDGNRVQCAEAIRTAFPDVRVLLSRERVGPGGGRNKLMAAAESDL
ncbi:MAG TPA: glycosyltransferase, partial [Pyrinomonadaceae bacterium]